MCERIKNPIKKFEIFDEAISHCRWKKNIYKIINQINIKEYNKKSFDDIFTNIFNKTTSIKGVGLLSTYDIVAAICRFHNVIIDKVFIIGNGPKNAIKLLKLKCKTYKINNIKLKYVDINEVKNAFIKEHFTLESNIKTCVDGDLIESFLCNWQKSFKHIIHI